VTITAQINLPMHLYGFGIIHESEYDRFISNRIKWIEKTS
jgi:hypothetical protein